MKYSTMFVVLVVAIALGPNRSSVEGAWVTYYNDFDTGIGSDFSIINGSGLFTVDTDGPSARVSKPEDDGTIDTAGFIHGGIRSSFSLVGDFIVTVDYSLDNLPKAPTPGLNESQLRCLGSSGTSFAVLHYTSFVMPQTEIEVWGPGGNYGHSVPAPALQGRYRIVRNGANMAGYFEEGPSGSFSLIWQGNVFTDDVQVELFVTQGTNYAGQPRSTTPLDISYDNLDIIAEDIVFSEPSTLFWTGIGGTTWSTATGLNNWEDSDGMAVDYANGDDVVFDDTATGSIADISVAYVTPSSVLFDNTAKNFAVQGSKGITGNTDVTKRGSGKVALNTINTYTGLTTVEAGTLELGLMAQAPVLTGGGADLQGGKIVLDYIGGSSPAVVVKAALTASYATGFTSGQIHSSTATTALGLGWVDDTGASELTIAATWYGDIDLDGNVNFIDLSKFLAGYNQAGNWAEGDFDYTGWVTFADLSRMLANYNQSLPGSINVGSYNLDGAAIQALSDAGITVVPEPSSLLLLAMAGLGLLGYAWRRRRS